MSENSTVTVQVISTRDNGYNLIWIYVTWICFFFTTALPNLIVTLTVMRYRALSERKEYVVMAGLSFADFLQTTAYSIAGCHRLGLIFTDHWNSKSSTWSCVTLVHNVVWWFSTPTCGVMLVIVSLDRFLSVAAPLKHFSMTKSYARGMVGLVYCFSVFMCLLIVFLTFTPMHGPEQLAAPCFTGATVLAVNKYYAAFYMYVHSVTGVLSVVLYIGVGLVYWKKKQQHVAPNVTETNVALERKRQRNLTKNLAISCLCTTVFLIIPNGVAFTVEKVYNMPRWFLQFMWLFPPVNPFCNVVIYYKRQPDLRKGMRALLVNKLMPPDLNLWTVPVRNNQRIHRYHR